MLEILVASRVFALCPPRYFLFEPLEWTAPFLVAFSLAKILAPHRWPKYWPLIFVSFSASDQKLRTERSQRPGAMFVRFDLCREEKAQGRREKFLLI